MAMATTALRTRGAAHPHISSGATSSQERADVPNRSIASVAATVPMLRASPPGESRISLIGERGPTRGIGAASRRDRGRPSIDTAGAHSDTDFQQEQRWTGQGRTVAYSGRGLPGGSPAQ
jgi:hypothetical protein